MVLIYNTKLVSPGELTGWESLLSGRWSGSIALADPTVSGSSYTAAATMLCALPGDDWDQLDRLAVQLEGRVLPDSGDVVAAVAGGSCRVGVTLEETALKRQAQGADIAIVYPEEGTSAVPDGSALIAGAPHPDNAPGLPGLCPEPGRAGAGGQPVLPPQRPHGRVRRRRTGPLRTSWRSSTIPSAGRRS